VGASRVQSLLRRGWLSLPGSTDLLEMTHVVSCLFVFVSTQMQHLTFVSVPNSE